MVLDNIQVVHKSFGDGVIVEHVGKYITVDFGVAKKKFVYPDAFENFLKLSDDTLSAEIQVDIDNSRKAKQLIIDKKNEENFRAMTKGIVIPGKEATAGSDSEDEEARFKESEEI